ncbi:MAG: phenylpyruvate tautomerase MIF-related protein [Clostridia bacterium]
MPYVNLVTNAEVCKDLEIKLIDTLGKGIEVIAGKKREGLFIKIQGNCSLYKGGNITEPNAMVSVDLFGYSKRDELEEYSKIIEKIVHDELGVQADKLFINFTECRHWFSRGKCSTAYEV